MMLRDLRLFATCALLFTLPVFALVGVGAWTWDGPLSWGACIAAFAATAALMGRLMLDHVPWGPTWKSAKALDAGAWALAVALCPVLAFLIYAFGGAEMTTAYALALLSYPLTALQLDEALDGMARASAWPASSPSASQPS